MSFRFVSRRHRRAADFDVAQVLPGVAQAVPRHAQDQIEAGRHEGQPAGPGVEELLEDRRRIAHARQQQQAMPGLGHRPQSPQAEGMAQRQRHDLRSSRRVPTKALMFRAAWAMFSWVSNTPFLRPGRAGGIDQVGRVVQRGIAASRAVRLRPGRHQAARSATGTGQVEFAGEQAPVGPRRRRRPSGRFPTGMSASNSTATPPAACTAK